MWFTIEQFSNLTKISKQTIYKKIEKGLIKSKKDLNNGLLIEMEIQPEFNLNQQKDAIIDLKTIKDFIGGLITEDRKRTDIIINKMEYQYNELKDLYKKELLLEKERYNEIIKMKNQEIERLKSENDILKKNQKKGLLDLFNN